jgi:hypothetical protein
MYPLRVILVSSVSHQFVSVAFLYTFQMSSWTGRLFAPRGVTGLQKQIQAEMKSITRQWTLLGDEIQQIPNLDILSRLRIPQSVWVPLVDTPVTSFTEFETVVSNTDWDPVPALKSHGPRVSLSKDSILSRSVGKEQLLDRFTTLSGIGSTEVSIRIDSLNRMSIQMNGIAPRVWVPTPSELDRVSEGVPQTESPWWSVAGNSTPSSSLSELSIKAFRNESSLCCMVASLLRSAGVIDRINRADALVIWDPFVGPQATVVMETLDEIFHHGNTLESLPPITFVGNVGSEKHIPGIKSRLDRFCLANAIHAESLPDEPHMFSTTLTLPTNKRQIHIHLTTRAFQETLPYMQGALVLSHIPKSYSEQLGLAKRQLSEWTAFGDLLRREKGRFEIFVLSETGAFLKYTKMKFATTIHMVSPGGYVAASVSKWLGY